MISNEDSENVAKEAIDVEKKNMNIQIVVSRNDKFLIFKRFRDQVACIVPYYKYDKDDYGCDFSIPNRNTEVKRIQNAYEMVESISSYTVSANNVSFDCLENFPEGIFKEDNIEGWIHFNQNSLIEANERHKTTVVQIDDRTLFEKVPDEWLDSGKYDLEFEQKLKIRYRPFGIKIFPVIFDEGFILVNSNKYTNTATMYVTVLDIQRMFVGNAVQGEVNNLIKNVLPFFPFFNCGVNEEMANVYLKNIGGLKEFLSNLTTNRCLLKFTYVFSRTNLCLCRVIGL